jgi:hypothetical protein
MKTALIDQYGSRWARNKKNLQKIEVNGKVFGVYVLCDGSMPVYIGRGRIKKRLESHMRRKRRGQFWDHFSWFSIADRKLEADIEALLLRMLPFYLRSLNRLRNRFVRASKIEEALKQADYIKMPPFVAKRKRK